MQIRTSVLLLFAVILGTRAEEEEDAYTGHEIEDCVRLGHDNCPSPSDKAFRALRGRLPDEKFLLAQCEHMLNELQCKDEFNETCPVANIHPFKGYRALKLAIQDVCNGESSFRRSYVENAGCVNDHLKDFETNIMESFRTMEGFARHYKLFDEIQPENRRDVNAIVQCVVYHEMHSVIENSLQSLCGEDAANLFLTIEESLIDDSFSLCPDNLDDVQSYLQLLQEYKTIRRPLEPVLNAIGAK